MKRLRSIILAAALWLLSPKSRYEGGQTFSPDRSWLPAYVRDIRFDADTATRTELVRKSRYFERNSALVNRLVDLFEQFTVGAGLQLLPNSSDERWNDLAKAWWDQWGNFCDLTSRSNFGTIQSLIARTWFVDGEVFLYKTQGSIPVRSSTGQYLFRPRLQLIEGHRVATPRELWGQEGRTIIDGIAIDDRGRPVGYYVADGLDADTFRYVPATDIIHIFEPSRPGQYRGLPFLYPTINDLHDLDDLQMLEMQAAKEAAKTSKVIKNQSGELDDEDLMRGTVTGADGEDKTVYYKGVFGAEVKVLKPGDEYSQFESNRPSVATREFWRHLTEKVCSGIGIPYVLVSTDSMQGTVYRGALDMANAFFRARSSVLASAFREIYIWVLGWARFAEIALSDAPADWTQVTIRAPRAVNVDVGRNSAAMIGELRAGTTTWENICAEDGEDWRKVLRQRAREAAYIRQLATEFEITPGEIADLAIDAIAKASGTDQQSHQSDEPIPASQQ